MFYMTIFQCRDSLACDGSSSCMDWSCQAWASSSPSPGPASTSSSSPSPTCRSSGSRGWLGSVLEQLINCVPNYLFETFGQFVILSADWRYRVSCRYLDITLGIMLTVSMVCLLYGSYSLLPSPLIIFFSLSLTVVLSYWLWYLYTNYILAHYPVFEEQVSQRSVLYRDNTNIWLLFTDGENWLNSHSDLLTPDDPRGSALQRNTYWDIARHSYQL